MADTRTYIEYASSPPPLRARTHPFFWWLIADLFLYASGIVVLFFAYNELPVDKSPPPAVDALISVLLFGGVALTVILIVWALRLAVSQLLRHDHAA